MKNSIGYDPGEVNSIGYSEVGSATLVTIAPYQSDESLIIKNMRYFESKCQRAGLEYRSHWDTDLFVLQELQTESKFSDLMILSIELFYENMGKEQPNDYLRKTLRQSECPVLLVPEKFKLPNKLMLVYDGKADGVFAIKQFTYLFSKWFH